MSPLLGPVRWWVQLYTSGLATSTRHQRRVELESDMWEQTRSESESGSGDFRIAASIWTRWLVGVPDDLAWRAEQVAASREPSRQAARSSKVDTVTSRNKLFGLGSAVAAILIVAVAIGVFTIASIQPRDGSDNIVAWSTIFILGNSLFVAGLAAIAIGFFVMNSRPAEGAALAVGGSLTAGLLSAWLLVTPVLAVAISIYAIRRARRIAGDLTAR